MKKPSLISILKASAAWAATGILFLAVVDSAVAQNSFDRGTPAESKGGLSSLSTYAQDKIETVNLANGNLTVHLPLVTVGGRGSALYTIALSYNSKLWSGQHEAEVITDPLGSKTTIHHFAATFDDGTINRPNLVPMGAGWFILKAPTIKVKKIGIDNINNACPEIKEGAVYKYVLTKMWVVLPDGSEVEMRDSLTEGAPYLKPDPCGGEFDRNRGRVWHSTDGSSITYVTDDDTGFATGDLSGWVFLADGSRLRVGSGGRCKKIVDPDGNFLDIDYSSTTNTVTYTDQLGRQVVLQWTMASGSTAAQATVTVKGYNGTADRVIVVDTDDIGGNLRSDFLTVQQPIFSSDTDINGVHGFTGAHTDLFAASDVYAGSSEVSAELTVVRLNLLDGRQFQFRYNQFGELAEIIYPGGGVSQIDYQAFGSSICDGGGTVTPQLNRRVTQRRTLPDGLSVDAVWNYIRDSGTIGGTVYPRVTLEARQGSSSGPLLLSEAHYFLALDAEYRSCSGLNGSNGTAYEKFENAREFRVERQTGTGTLIQSSTWFQLNVDWSFDPTYSNDLNHGPENPPNDPRVITEDTTLENGKVKRVQRDYDAYNNVTREREYDFGQVLIKDTSSIYLTSQNGYCYTNLNGTDSGCGSTVATDGTGATDPTKIIHRRRLLLSETVKDGSGNVEAYTEYEYDNYLNDGNHASLQLNSGMIQYDGSWFTPFAAQSQPRGNVTSVKRLISGPISGGTYATAYSQYDEAGNVVKTIDPRGNPSTVSYADNFGDGTNPDAGSVGTNGATFAFPSSATNALNQSVKTQYSYSRGVATGVKDLNGVVTITEYNDPYDRPTRITAAYSLAEASKTEMSYPTAVANQTTVSKQLDSTRWLAYKTTYDGFGRPLTGNEAEDGNHALVANFTITSRRIYDGLGRIIFATNAYRSSPASTDGWTRTAYDLAGRVIDVATFSGSPSTQPPDYPATTGTGVTWTGSVQTSYASEVTTVTDQAGKQRRSVVDGIGRLVSIVEDPTGFGYQTNYSYDARGNLKTVSQGVQTRTFSYDTLSRLTSATNPESGQVTYTYDLASNLKTRLDNRGITTTYNYDAINRVTSRTYSGDPENTPPVSYFYDGQTLPSGAPPAFVRGSSVGRVVAVTYGSGSSNGTYTGYDHLGRVNTSVQQTDGANHAFSYAYNLAGMIASETYPSNRQVTTSFDGAGRTSQIVGTLAGQNTTYASNFSYTAHDAPGVLKLGNNKWEHTSFSSRLEPTQIGLGNSSSDSSILQLDYGYGSTNNNGNVLSQTITVGATVMSQAYSYDSLNRLSSANENNGTDWSQTYGYDRYGNRWVSASTGYNLSPLTPTGSGAFSASNNKLIASGYDNAGNQTTDVQGRQFAYDAENRQIRFNNTVGRYFYDGDGHRVKKIDASGTTVFVYNSMGQLIAEYSDVAASGPGGTSYLTADHLGSTRVVTDEGGNVKARHDYLPFGEEIPANIGGRSSVPGYSAADTTRQRFGGKERDAESNLDYFGGRYYGSATGRFNSPDPIIISARRMINPQIWNLYSYVGNNPLSYIDPNGEELVKLGQHTDEEIKRRQQEIDQQLKSLKKDQSLTKDQRKEQEQKLKAEKKTLGLEREGNKAVGALLNALDKIGQRNGLALSDFTLSTDTKNDFKGFATPDAMKKLLNDQAFVIRDNPKFGGTIYIRTEPAAGFYQLSQRNSDFLYYGATSVRHEQEHLLGRGEGPAYRVQDNVMHLFQNYFQNRDLYKGLDEALHDAIKKNP